MRNGTAIFQPYDDWASSWPEGLLWPSRVRRPPAYHPAGLEGGFNGVALEWSSGRKFYWEYAGEVPLGAQAQRQTGIPATAEQVLPANAAWRKRSARRGRGGLTLYVGMPGQEARTSEYLGCAGRTAGEPLIVWAYPRGAASRPRAVGTRLRRRLCGPQSSELGGDVVKVNFPQSAKPDDVPNAYRRRISRQEATTAVARQRDGSLWCPVAAGWRRSDAREGAALDGGPRDPGRQLRLSYSSAGSPSLSNGRALRKADPGPRYPAVTARSRFGPPVGQDVAGWPGIGSGRPDRSIGRRPVWPAAGA